MKERHAYMNREIKVRTISPNDAYHYFFGYYDLNAYHKNGKYHLANRVKFMDRLPEKDDVCELGYIDLENGGFTKFAETTAWNFQQGALLTYNAADYDEVFYNVRNENGYATCIHNLKTGQKRYTDRACACIAPNGKYGLAVSFERIYDFRPGYGYAGIKDPLYDIPQPENDGVWLVDLKSGKSKLIIPVSQVLKQFPIERFKDAKFVVNHITFNTLSDRFLFLLRNFRNEQNTMWSTSLITSDLDGKMYCRLKDTLVSHYNWKNEKQILMYAEIDGKRGVYLADDMSDKYIRYDVPAFDYDIHCVYSPDRRYFIGDDYPRNGVYERRIHLYDTKSGEYRLLLSEETLKPDVIDIRCDLHNRFNCDGTRISYDSTQSGKREIREIVRF